MQAFVCLCDKILFWTSVFGQSAKQIGQLGPQIAPLFKFQSQRRFGIDTRKCTLVEASIWGAVIGGSPNLALDKTKPMPNQTNLYVCSLILVKLSSAGGSNEINTFSPPAAGKWSVLLARAVPSPKSSCDYYPPHRCLLSGHNCCGIYATDSHAAKDGLNPHTTSVLVNHFQSKLTLAMIFTVWSQKKMGSLHHSRFGSAWEECRRWCRGELYCHGRYLVCWCWSLNNNQLQCIRLDCIVIILNDGNVYCSKSKQFSYDWTYQI